jgi:hypothetical protein
MSSQMSSLTGLDFHYPLLAILAILKIEENPTHGNETQEPAAPVCCNSGCIVCVLDFPELFAATVKETTGSEARPSDLLAMLEAIEAAEETADRLLLSTPESD